MKIRCHDFFSGCALTHDAFYGDGSHEEVSPEDAIDIAVDNREAWRAWMPPNAFLPNSGEEYSSVG
jgi:hypothetical protein